MPDPNEWQIGDLADQSQYAGLGGDPTHLSGLFSGMVGGLVDYAKRPGQTMAPNPYPPGSEEAQFYEDQRRSNTYRIAPEAAMNLAGTGTPFAVRGGLGMAGGKPPIAPGALAAVDEYRPPFYSAVEQAVQGAKQNAAPGQQWAGFLRNQPGVKPEEVEALKLGKLFEQPGSVPKEAVLGEIAANRVNVGEVVKGQGRDPGAIQRAKEAKEKFSAFAKPLAEKYGINEEHNLAMYSSLKKMDPTEVANYEVLQRNWQAAERAVDKPETKFGSYTLPGGENYREMLLTLPKKPVEVGPAPELLTELPKGPDWDNSYRVIRYRGDGPEREWGVIPPGQSHARAMAGQHPTEAEAVRQALNHINAQNAQQYNQALHDANKSGQFTSSHFDEPNVLAHVRYNDRYIDNAKNMSNEHPGKDKVLFVEEVQSDWHQKGKREGYTTPPDQDAVKAANDRVAQLRSAIDQKFYEMRKDNPNLTMHQASLNSPEIDALSRQFVEADNARHALERKPQLGVPDAPFKTTWPELAMKRIIREAAEKGYDKVAWTPGSVQADRYDLSRHIEKVRAVKNDDGTFQLVATPKNGTAIMLGGGRLPADEMADHIGKDLAEKIVKDIEAKSGNNWGVKNKQSGNWSQRFASKEEAEAFQQSLPETTRKQTDVLAMAPKYSTEYSGLDLKVGGEGMKGFYDEILPATVNRLVKKHGGRVQQGEMFEGSPEKWIPRRAPDGQWMLHHPDSNYDGSLRFPTREAALAELHAGKKQSVHTIDITPSLRAAAMKGFPLFSAGGVAATGAIGELARQDEYR